MRTKVGFRGALLTVLSLMLIGTAIAEICPVNLWDPNDYGSKEVISKSRIEIPTSTAGDQETWMHPNEQQGFEDPPPNTPLVMDFAQPGIVTSDVLRTPVSFDLDGDGAVEDTGWLSKNSGDAFLWIDLNGNKVVDSGAELFGSASTIPDGSGARHGFEALAAYDEPRFGGDGDGTITRQDRIWARLRLWFDGNQDGISTPDEIKRLGQEGILGIDLSWEEVKEMDGAANWRLFRGTYWVRGFAGAPQPLVIEDIAFRTIDPGPSES